MIKKRIAFAAIVVSFTSACFFEDFEQGGGDWTVDNGLWEFGTPMTFGPDACNEGKCAGTVLDNHYPRNNSRLISPTLWLIPANISDPFPSMKFWHWYDFHQDAAGTDFGRLQISIFDPLSLTWSAWMDLNDDTFVGASGAWTFAEVALGPHTGNFVRLAFQHNGDRAFFSAAGWYVDVVEIPGIPISFFD